MRNRFNILAVAVVLAILSFAYARYDYSNKNSTTLLTLRETREHHRQQSVHGQGAVWRLDEGQELFAMVAPVGAHRPRLGAGRQEIGDAGTVSPVAALYERRTPRFNRQYWVRLVCRLGTLQRVHEQS